MVGMRFGALTVIRFGKGKCLCRCDCGEDVEVWRTNLIQGKKTHCGCQKYADRDLTGRRFTRWLVLSRFKGSCERWVCRCDCGNEGVVSSTNLRKRRSRSCGCHHRERAKKAGEKNRKFSVEHSLSRGARPNVSSWRRLVIQRDGGRCRICGSSEEISVHHKDGWFVSPPRRMDVGNGVSLCRHHHSDFHRRYGKGNTTQEQWDAYEREITHLHKSVQHHQDSGCPVGAEFPANQPGGPCLSG